MAPTVSDITSDRSIFALPSKLTPCIVLAVASAVAVEALPVKAPVTSPVTSPSISATNIAFAYPVPLVFTVVVGSACRLLNNFHLPLSLASLNRPA